MKIICLDIDDTIFPSNNTYFGRVDDNFEILNFNMKRIKMMIEKYDMKVFIISAWYSKLDLCNDGTLKLKDSNISGPSSESFAKAFEIVSSAINGNVIGLSKGNRNNDIKNLLDADNLVVAIDDTDLSSIKNDNYLFVETHGFITNNLTYKIDSFMNSRKKESGFQLKKKISR